MGETEAAARSGGGFLGREDRVAAGVIFAAAIIFVGAGVQVVPAAVTELFRAGGGSDRIAAVALLLDVALILIAWRRYKDVRAEIEMRRRAEARAEILSSRDHLTNLLVRQSIGERGDKLIAAVAPRFGDAGLLVVDIDRFKNINDNYGHIAGDALLRAVAGRVEAAAPADALCARVGADEFCVLLALPDRDPAALGDFAETLLARLSAPVEISGGIEIHVRASAGLARIGADCDNVDSLLRRANIALQQAKRAGGSRAVWFDGSMESELKARNGIEAGLRRGIPAGEFVPYYQPQVELGSGSLVGFEVLTRWAHPAGGTIGPDRFIPVAEETGLIGDLFDSICYQALSEARDWDPALTIAVNVSPVQLKDPWLAHRILKILTEVGFPAERLEIEITESSLFENLALAQSIVASLKNQGVRLALDDFGTGYSSLAHLRALPFDKIKIDRSFVQSMGRDAGSRAIVTAIAGMAESVGVPVTAEGIEEEASVAALLEVGCRYAQGWLYGRPISGAETAEFLGAAERPAGALPAAPSAAAGPRSKPMRSAA